LAGLDSGTVIIIVLEAVLVGIIVAIASFLYGKWKGSQQALKKPNIVYPNIHEITVLGKYSIPNQSTEKIGDSLTNWANREGYSLRSFPNVIEILNVTIPPQASKKKNYFDRLALTRDGVPQQLTLNLYPSTSGTTIEVDTICLPVMYNKLGQLIQQAFPKSSVEDAQRQCKDFTTNAMCILKAEVLTTPDIESAIVVPRITEFLYNTPVQNNINKKAHELIANAKSRVFLTGWVDREFLGEFEKAKLKGLAIRIITKNPDSSDRLIKDDYERLLKIFGRESIRINSRFHDRFLICDNSVIIGSMYYVDASKTRYESVVITTEENIVNGLVNHFQQIWDDVSSKSPKQ